MGLEQLILSQILLMFIELYMLCIMLYYTIMAADSIIIIVNLGKLVSSLINKLLLNTNKI